jgi:fumarate reductase flavoprotein subunit
MNIPRIWFPALLAVVLSLAACPDPNGAANNNGTTATTDTTDTNGTNDTTGNNDTTDDTGDNDTTSESGPGEGSFSNLYFSDGDKKYFSFSTGKELDPAKSSTAEWDLALDSQGFWVNIYTNSGATAQTLGPTGGQGGVWFTNKKDFDGAAFADRVTDFSGLNAEFAPYVTDVARYQGSMDGTGTPVSMNMMTYYGFYSGTGTQTDPFAIHPDTPARPFFSFNRKGYTYSPAGMPPKWYPTGQVYLIRHADGASYSKFQVTAITYISGYNFRLSFRFKNVPPAEGGPQPLMVPGTYSGTAYGYGATPITVSAVLTETALTSVTVTAHSESTTRPGVAAALTSVPQDILTKQSLAADAVSGASLTRGGIIEAVKNCIFQAGDGRALTAFGATSL